MRKILVIGILALIVCATALTPSSAYEVSALPIKDIANDGSNMIANVVISENGTVSIGNTSTVAGTGKTLKAVEIPESWKKINNSGDKLLPTDQDWACIEGAMTDLSEKERQYLI